MFCSYCDFLMNSCILCIPFFRCKKKSGNILCNLVCYSICNIINHNESIRHQMLYCDLEVNSLNCTVHCTVI